MHLGLHPVPHIVPLQSCREQTCQEMSRSVQMVGQAVREQSEDLRLLRSAVNEAKAAMQRRQQERDQQLLKVLQLPISI